MKPQRTRGTVVGQLSKSSSGSYSSPATSKGSLIGSGHHFSMTLEPWGWKGGPVEPGALTLSTRVKEAEVFPLMERFQEGHVVEQAVTKMMVGGTGQPLAIGRRPIKRLRSLPESLKATSAALARPVVVKHATLGTLTWDRELSSFVGKPQLAGKRCEVIIEAPREVGPAQQRAIERAATAIRRALKMDQRVREVIAECLLETYNDTWNSGPELSAARFLGRPRLEGVTVFEDGALRLFFGDGGLFAGHSIQVSVTRAGVPRDATI